MKLIEKLPTVSRIALGLVFTVFGLNGFLHFLPQPPLPESAVPFMTGLMSTGYFFPLLKGTEVLAGVLLLTRTAVPLALVLLAPIVVNIAAFHLVVSPGNYAMTALLGVWMLHLAWANKSAFEPLFTRPKAKAAVSDFPGAVPAPAAE
jgi:putative oxidoreductase